MRSRTVLAVIVLLLFGVSACGGDSSDPEEVVREFADAISGSDAEKLCKDLLSEEAREQVSGATGDEADDQCEQELSRSRGRQIEVRRIVSEKVDGDNATVIAEVEQGRATGRQVFRLKKEDGDFRIASLE